MRVFYKKLNSTSVMAVHFTIRYGLWPGIRKTYESKLKTPFLNLNTLFKTYLKRLLFKNLKRILYDLITSILFFYNNQSCII